MEHASAIFLSILVALAGGINAWQNVNIKLAIAQLRNELFEKVATHDTRLAVMEAAAAAEDKWRDRRRGHQGPPN